MVTYALCLGLLEVIVILLFMFFKQRKFNRQSITALGTILGIEQKTVKDIEGHESEIEVGKIQFDSINQGQIVVERKLPFGKYFSGNKIDIHYLPQDPTRSNLSKNNHKILGFLAIAGVVGILTLIFLNYQEWQQEYQSEIRNMYQIITGFFIFSYTLVYFVLFKMLNKALSF